jgi:hypothetical protein
MGNRKKKNLFKSKKKIIIFFNNHFLYAHEYLCVLKTEGIAAEFSNFYLPSKGKMRIIKQMKFCEEMRGRRDLNCNIRA